MSTLYWHMRRCTPHGHCWRYATSACHKNWSSSSNSVSLTSVCCLVFVNFFFETFDHLCSPCTHTQKAIHNHTFMQNLALIFMIYIPATYTKRMWLKWFSKIIKPSKVDMICHALLQSTSLHKSKHITHS